MTHILHGQLLTGETPFHKLKKFSFLITLMNTANIPAFGALWVEVEKLHFVNHCL